MTAIEEALDALGSWGRYQTLIFLAVCLLWLPGGLHVLSYVFLGATPLHRCFLPQWDSKSTATSPQYSLPLDVEQRNLPFYRNDNDQLAPSQCERFDPPLNATSPPFANISNTIECRSFVYDRAIYLSTTASEWDLVCHQDWKGSLVNSVYMFGVLIGAAAGGELADRFGRLAIIWAGTLLGLTAAIASALAPTYRLFLLARGLFALVYQTGLVAFVLFVEAAGSPSSRLYASFGLQAAFAIGEMMVAGFAYFIRDWRQLQMALCVPIALTLLILPFLPESIRWQHAKGRRVEAALRRAARINRVEIPERVMDALRSEETNVDYDDEQGSTVSRLEVFRYAALRRSFFVLVFSWFVSAMVFYGLALYTQELGGNQFVDSIMISFSELPGYVVAVLLLDRIGRKSSLMMFFAIGGVAILAMGIVPYYWHSVILTLALVGKCGISAAFGVVFIVTAEIFPTDYRSQCLGLCSMCARAGSIVSPFIALLADYAEPLPYFVFGLFGIAAAVLIIWLPETAGRALPDTVQEAEELSRNTAFSGGVAAYNRRRAEQLIGEGETPTSLAE